MGPKDIARSVILPDVSIASTCRDLSWEGPAGLAGHIDARRVRSYAVRGVETLGAELVGPRYVPGEVVFANETVHAARTDLPRQRALRAPDNVHAGSIDRHALGRVEIGRSEFAGPKEIAGDIIPA